MAVSRHLGPELALGNGPPSTLADQAYVRLREQVIRVELPPGTLLREEELMQRLGVGRTPVREAIQRLQRDVRHRPPPPRDARLGDQHHRPRRDLRGAGAAGVVGLAAGRRARHRGGPRGGRGADGSARGDRRRGLRGAARRRPASAPLVYRTSKNPFLAETLDHHHNLSLRILHVAMKRYPTLTPRLEEVVQEQRTMLAAVRRGDGDTPERVAVDHIRTFERGIREVI